MCSVAANFAITVDYFPISDRNPMNDSVPARTIQIFTIFGDDHGADKMPMDTLQKLQNLTCLQIPLFLISVAPNKHEPVIWTYD